MVSGRNLILLLNSMLCVSYFSVVYAEVMDESNHHTVEVVGTTIPPSTDFSTTLNLDNILHNRFMSSDTAKLLEAIPGISLYGSGGLSSLPVIHGMGDERLRVEVNGIPSMSFCSNHMNPPLSYVPPTQINNIQVWSGITPVSEGGDSIGGTISVHTQPLTFTREPSTSLSGGEVGTFYRSNGEGKGGHMLAFYANEMMSVRYNGYISQSNNIQAGKEFKPAGLSAVDRDYLAGNVIGSTAYYVKNNTFELGMQQANHMLHLTAHFQDIPYQLFPNQRMDMLGNNSQQFSLAYKNKQFWGDINIRAFRQRVDHDMQFGENKQLHYGKALGMPMKSLGQLTGLLSELEADISDKHSIKIGAELLTARLNDNWPAATSTISGMGPNDFQNIRHGRRDRFNTYAEWHANWRPNWLSELGIRHERVAMNTDNVQGYNQMPMYAYDADSFNKKSHGKYDHNWDITARMQYNPSKEQILAWGYARKTRSPNLYERYTWSAATMAAIMNAFVGDGNGYVGNLDLQPEVAHTVHFTWDLHGETKDEWQVKISPYYTYVNNYIDVMRCPLSFSNNCTIANSEAKKGFVNLQYVNQRAQLFGLDISHHLKLKETPQWGKFTLTGILSYVRGKNLTTGDNLYNIMPLHAQIALIHDWGKWTNKLAWQGVSAKNHVSSVRNEVPTAGFGLLHFKSYYTWQKLRFEMGINNLFNRLYFTPLGGAYLGQGKTMAANGLPWGMTVPGPGRSIDAAVTAQF